MSREVEVQNIKLTATVPEDIQISLGHIQHIVNQTTEVTVSNAKDHTGLVGNEGILTPALDAVGATADNGGVHAPTETQDAIGMLDWASTADISAYYRLGKIMPASSTTGRNIFFTPDSSGVGKTLKTGAGYYQAAAGLSEYKYQPAVAEPATPATFSATGSGDSAKTTLHAINNVTDASDEWNYVPGTTEGDYVTASGWNETNDDGYYVDIPVWLRTSSTAGATLAVDAYVTTDTAVDDDDLYLAARVAVLPDGESKFGSGETPSLTTSGLVEVRQDGWNGNSIVDFMTTTNNDGEAVNELTATDAAMGGKVASYSTETHYNGAQLIKLTGGTNNAYGTARKVWIRVWLEGEDPNCWNQNAGQNFNICVKFTKEAVSPAATVAPNLNPFGSGETVDSTVLVNGETHTVQFKEGETVKNTLVYTYNGTAWELTSGTYHSPDAGKKYSVSSTDWTSEEAASRTKLDTIVAGITTSTAAATPTEVTISATT